LHSLARNTKQRVDRLHDFTKAIHLWPDNTADIGDLVALRFCPDRIVAAGLKSGATERSKGPFQR
jgi:hypothetical protein